MLQNTVNSKPYKWRRWLFTSAVLVQLLVAILSIFLMSTVRTVASGESLWTKGLYAAFMHLQRYAEDGEPQDLHNFQTSLSIPIGLGRVRAILDSGQDDEPTMRASLLQGQIHPDDMDTVIKVLPLVWNTSTLAPTIAIWRLGDSYALELQILGDNIAMRRNMAQAVSASEIEAWLTRISSIKDTVIPLANLFTASLSNRSRDIGRLLILINLMTAGLLSTLYWLSAQRAINESNKAYSDLEVERLRSATTLAALGDGVLTLDTHQCIRYANPSASRLLDMHECDLLGRSVAQLLPFAPEIIAKHEAEKSTTSLYRPSDGNVHWIPRPEQDNVAVRVSITTLKEDNGHAGTVLVLHDVSQEQNYMRMLVWQQNHDLLTGLDNRSTFEKYLLQTIGKHQASLLHLNLDHFKMINASYGHAAGDEILRQVCQQLRLALRETDVLARIGGDEFAVLLSHCQPHAAMQTAERLRVSVHKLNVQWRQHNLHTGVSIGVVHIDPNHPNGDPQALLSMSESACKHAKESGRNRITVYDPFNRIFQRYQGDMEWVQRLRSSLENNQFTLMAQTVYPLKAHGKGMNGVHFEVLLRLQEGNGKLVAPSEFISIAERYDLMPHIDRWVVQNTIKLLKTHLSEGANISTCAINLSGASLGDSEFLEFIRNNILEQGVAAEKLCFEITETSAIASMDSAISMMDELRKLGCRFSIDDFGSGMASFKYLQQLPVDYLKIDGSFVKDMLKNPSNYAMVDAIHHIGHVMGKHTVAEFVGDAATFDALIAMGVDYAQGYYIAPPVPLDAAFFLRASMPPPQLAPIGNGLTPLSPS